MKPIHQASATVRVPSGFTGWWCERCERAVSLPDELGSPARCPHCRKPTAVWIPPSRGGDSRLELVDRRPYERVRPSREQAQGLFERMRRAAEGGEVESRMDADETQI